MVSFYRVIAEVIEDGRRTYQLAAVAGERRGLTRSCDPRVAPLRVGMTYSLAEIDERCPDERASNRH